MGRFGTSRITVGRALRELSQRGLGRRVAGSGTFVGRGHVSAGSLLFGLLIPDLGTSEIFEPICQGIAGAPTASRHGLLWGHTDLRGAPAEEQALGLCEQFIASHVAGVFFAPLERGAEARETNLTIVSRLEEARIPMVLLDRPCCRSRTLPARPGGHRQPPRRLPGGGIPGAAGSRTDFVPGVFRRRADDRRPHRGISGRLAENPGVATGWSTGHGGLRGTPAPKFPQQRATDLFVRTTGRPAT